MTVADTLDERVPYDLLLVTVLGHQIAPLLPALRRCAAKSIQFMFMTFEPERLQQSVGLARSALGMPYLQSNLDDHGRVSISVGGSSRQTLTSEPSCAAIFAAAGLPARHEDKMALWLRCHVPLGVAFESVAVAGKRRGKGAPWRRAQTLALGLSACYRLVRGEGYEIYPASKKRLDRLPVSLVATMLWGLSHVASFRNLLATGEAECGALVDAMLAAPVVTKGRPADRDAIRAMKPE